MEVRLLGSIAVEGNGAQATLGGRQRRAVLALLALAEGRVVSVDALVEALWGERPPPTAVNTVQVHMSALRKALAPVSDEGQKTIVRDGAGYRLAVSPTSVDHVRFVRLTDEGGVLLSRGDAAHARAAFAEALALWRGPALADFEYEEWAQAEARRLEDLRLSCLEGRIEAELATGRHSELVGELEALVAEHPDRERFTAQLLLALYRSGRQTEALDVYQQARERLVNELGIDPSPELQALYKSVLNQEEALAAPARVQAVAVVKLPTPATPLIGRERELAEIVALLGDEGIRMETIVGTGGVGKTRLALAAGREVSALFPDGVIWIPLQALRDPTLVVPAIEQALNVRGDLDAAIAERRLLLCLDNLEHLVSAGPELAQLLSAYSGLKILATSREPLHLSAEHRYPLAPLAEHDATALFAARARAVRPEFTPNGEVEEICRRLDHLPLALELAAARVATLTTAQIIERLDDRLRLLTGGPRDAPQRQSTLRTAVEWSYDLLGEDEQQLFVRLSVFVGGFSLEAAENICDADLDTLSALVDKSLLCHTDDGRFFMLETIREYARERLDERGEAEKVAPRHAEYFAALARQAEPELVGASMREWLARLSADHDNLRAARAWLRKTGDSEREIRLVTAVWLYLMARGHLTEGRTWLDGALTRRGELSPQLRTKALFGAAILAAWQGAYERARTLSEENLALARGLADAHSVACALDALGLAVKGLGDYRRAASLFDECQQLARKLGDEWLLSIAINNLGDLALNEGAYERAAALFEESLALGRKRADAERIARTLVNLASANLELGHEERALSLLRESLGQSTEAGLVEVVGLILDAVAAVAATRGQAERAAKLVAKAETVREELGRPMESFEQARNERVLATAREQLGLEAFSAASAEGAVMSLDEAVAYAQGSDE